MADEGRSSALTATAEFHRVLRQRPSPWRAIVATAAAVVALAAGRELLVPPAGADVEVVAAADEGAALARLLVDDHARERGDRQAALRAIQQLRVGSQALALARKRYVEPARLDPRAMLRAALSALSHAVPPMLVRDDGDALEVSVDAATLALPLQGLDDLFRLDRALMATMRFLAPRLPAEVAAAELEYLAINGALQTLDPYSRMLDPDAWREMRTHTGGQFGGLGIRILVVAGVLTVVGVIDGSPAAEAGLQEKDQILRIDGDDTLNMAVDDAVARLRGDVGASARLLIRREGWRTPRELELVRAVIQLSSVEGRLLDDGVAYARVKGFQRGTAKELAGFLAGLPTPPRGLVLDLRGNPGGLLEEAVALVSLFVDRGPVVATVGASQTRDVRPARPGGPAIDLPLAVLVDRRSASASEIVAGALQTSSRALLIGERSFGKGTVQVPFEIGDGALKLTVAQYLVGEGVVIQGRGVMPDVAIDFVSVLGDRVSLFDADAARRRAEAEARGQRSSHRLRVLVPLASQRGKEEQASPALFRDAEPIRRAAELLRRAGAPTALGMLPKLRGVIGELQQADAIALHRALQRVGIDWRAGPRSPEPRLRVQVTRPAGGLQVDAGQTLALPVTVTNHGKRALYRVHVRSRCDAPAFDGYEAVIGRLGAGQSRRVTLRLRPSGSHLDLVAPVAVQVFADGVDLGAAAEATITIRGRPRPTLSFRYALQATDAAGIAEGGVPAPLALRPGVALRLRVEVRNEGPGVARAAEVALRSLAGAHLRLMKGRAALGRLDPGQTAVAWLEVEGGSSTGERAGLLEARLQFNDASTGWTRQSRIYLPWLPRDAHGRPAASGDLEAAVAVGLPLEASRLADAEARRWNRPPALRLLGADGELDAPLAEASTPSALDADAVDDDRVDASPDAGRIGPLAPPCRLRLRAAARFEVDGPSDRYVTVSVESRKQRYHDARGRMAWRLDEDLTLAPGLSRVTLLAQAGPDRVATRVLLVHCAGGGPQTTAATTTAVPEARAIARTGPPRPGTHVATGGDLPRRRAAVTIGARAALAWTPAAAPASRSSP